LTEEIETFLAEKRRLDKESRLQELKLYKLEAE
jgi:hypothetical protein